MTPLVSILIPCYNADRWIAQAIESALGQTWSSKEVIVVDDGSTDGSLEIIQRFGDSIRWETGPNGGGNVARNRLLRLAQGRWLQYLDADDYLLPEKIERQMYSINQCGSVDVVYGTTYGCYDSTGEKWLITADPKLDVYGHFIQWAGLTTNSLLLRKSTVTAVGGWDESAAYCQERELLLRLLLNEAHFIFLNEPGAVYRFDNSASISRSQPLAVVKCRVQLTDQLVEFMGKRGLRVPANERALALARMECVRTLYPADPEMARDVFKKVVRSYGRLVPASSATRLLYRIALAMLGLDRAEALAHRTRYFRRL